MAKKKSAKKKEPEYVRSAADDEYIVSLLEQVRMAHERVEQIDSTIDAKDAVIAEQAARIAELEKGGDA